MIWPSAQDGATFEEAKGKTLHESGIRALLECYAFFFFLKKKKKKANLLIMK